MAVDEKILELQQRKQKLCSSALGSSDGDTEEVSSKDEARRLSLADLRICFEARPVAAAGGGEADDDASRV